MIFAFSKITNISKVPFFGYLANNKFPYYLALIIPYNLVKHGISVVFAPYPDMVGPLLKLVDIYLVLTIVWLTISVIKSGIDWLREKSDFRYKPLNSYLQVIQGIIYLIGLIQMYSILTDQSPTAFFAAMGAASAVLMLVFKDSIMGFVASIQLTANDMLRIDDWITVPKYGANGDVMEINLTTIKVRNFDKTITTIPTYALISDSFQNWRGMQLSGGRRIKRAIIIKQSSIRYIADEELDRFRQIQGIRDYIDARQAEIIAHNENIEADRIIPVNGRNLTNAGLFRNYAEWYLRSHPGVNKDMTLMVRQLAPTDSGLPFELYVFTNTVNWIKYEETMSDIFDHLIAAVKYFDLQIFEKEAGGDIKNIQLLPQQ
jgi:miniconductance mechanosensitive channel